MDSKAKLEFYSLSCRNKLVMYSKLVVLEHLANTFATRSGRVRQLLVEFEIFFSKIFVKSHFLH
jgi:hypothetical protein